MLPGEPGTGATPVMWGQATTRLEIRSEEQLYWTDSLYTWRSINIITNNYVRISIILTVQPNAVATETGLLLGLKARVNTAQGERPRYTTQVWANM